MKGFLFVLLLCLSLLSFAQKDSKMSFAAKSKFTQAQKTQESITFFVKGELVEIQALTQEFKGEYLSSFKNNHLVKIPSSTVFQFIQRDEVEHVVCDAELPQILTDKLLEKSNVLPLHQGVSPLPYTIKGDDVVIGIVDTGIDFTHPDFKNSDGTSRVKYIWDQRAGFSAETPAGYDYGIEWTNDEINSGSCTHTDPNSYYGHGTNVAGIAASNGGASGQYKGVAPNADIIFVATDFSSFNWAYSVAEACKYIFEKADELGKPCVINLSLGTYFGSHDGIDLASLMINDLVNEKPGRSVVCAAGNAGLTPNFHLGYEVTSDTSFTWFKENPSSLLGYPSIYFQLWADTADFNNVEFALGVDKVSSTSVNRRGTSTFLNIDNFMGQLVTEKIKNENGDTLCTVDFYSSLEDSGRYFMEVHIREPDSSAYNFSFLTKGSGKFDVWSTSSSIMRTSDMLFQDLPSVDNVPEMAFYKSPDSLQSIVSNWACSPHVITVGNYVNRDSYLDFSGVTQQLNFTSNEIYQGSSVGPARTGLVKPDVCGPGSTTLTSAPLSMLNDWKTSAPSVVAPDGLHRTANGTSMASPGVAGIVALMYQKCTQTSNESIIETLHSSAKQDSYTQNVPNPVWGYGKADAFKSVINTGGKIPLSASGDTTVCSSLSLYSSNSYSTYDWSTGSSFPILNCYVPGSYFLLAYDENNCFFLSDSVHMSIDSYTLDSPELTVLTDTILCLGDTFRVDAPSGFSNYFWSNGGSGNAKELLESDIFNVTVIDNTGCMGVSKSVTAIFLAAPPVPFIYESNDTLYSSTAHSYQWLLEGIVSVNDTLRGILPQVSGNYSVLVFNANGCSNVSEELFYQTLNVNESSGEFIKVLRNPTSETLLVYTSMMEAKYKIYSMNGSLLKEGSIKNGLNEIELSHLSKGVYFLNTTSEQQSSAFKIILQ